MVVSFTLTFDMSSFPWLYRSKFGFNIILKIAKSTTHLTNQFTHCEPFYRELSI
jgi:hypothetical protein